MRSGGGFGSRHTLTGRIDDFHKAHFIVHYKLFSIRVLYCWIISLGIGVSYRARGGDEREEKGRTSGQVGEGDGISIGQEDRDVVFGSSPTKQLRVNWEGESGVGWVSVYQ